MAVIRHKLKGNLTIVLTLIWCLSITCTTGYVKKDEIMIDPFVDRIMDAVDKSESRDNYHIARGVTIRRDVHVKPRKARISNSTYQSFFDKIEELAQTRRMDIKLSQFLPQKRSITSGKLSHP